MSLQAIPAHESAKRVIEIAVAGGHSLALIGCVEFFGEMVEAMHALACYCRVATPPLVDPAHAAMVLDLPPLHEVDRKLPPLAERDAAVRARISAAHAIPSSDAPIEQRGEYLLQQAEAYGLIDTSARRASVIAVARTIARLAGHTGGPDRIHIAEALSYVRHA